MKSMLFVWLFQFCSFWMCFKNPEHCGIDQASLCAQHLIMLLMISLHISCCKLFSCKHFWIAQASTWHGSLFFRGIKNVTRWSMYTYTNSNFEEYRLMFATLRYLNSDIHPPYICPIHPIKPPRYSFIYTPISYPEPAILLGSFGCYFMWPKG